MGWETKKTMAAKVLLSGFRNKVYRDRERFEELSRFVEGSLLAELKRRKDHAIRELDGVSDEFEASFLAECHAEDIFLIERDFPRIQRYALFVSLMGIGEANVVRLCRTAQRIFDISEAFNARSPQVISRGIAFLTRGTNIDTSRLSHFTDITENLPLLRNCIAHSEGSLRYRKGDEAELIRQYIASRQNAKVDEQDRIVLQEGFVEGTNHQMNAFLVDLHDTVKNKLL